MFDRLHRAFRPVAIAFYNELRRRGWRPSITSTYRSLSKQRRLYQRYLRGQSIYPAAPPGSSLHNYGLAFDLVVPGHQEEAQQLWRSWGGHLVANDPVHFEPSA